MNCNKVAVPGTEKPSLLYASLEQKYGEERALQLWTWAHQHDFAEKDENGEPTAAAVEAALPKQEEIVNANPAPAADDFRKIAQTEVNPLDINPEALNKQLELTAVKLPDGGYWEAVKQEQVVDSIQYKLFNLFPKAISDPALQDKLKAEGKSTLDYVKERIKNDIQKFHDGWNSANMGKIANIQPSAHSAERVATARAILDAFDTDKGFWHFTMKRLENLGIKFKNGGAALESPDSTTLEHVNAEAGDKEIDLQDSEGLKDWFQDSFTLDMKDTLSTAMKMFMANIENSQFTDTANLRFVQLSLNNDNTARDIASGAKKDFYINPRYAQKMGIVLPEEVDKSLTPLEQKNQYSMMSNLKGIVKLEAEKRLTEADLTPELKERVKREEGFEPEVGHLKMKVTYYPNKPAELTTEKNFLGLPTLADANSLYTETMSHLTGIEPSFSAYLKALKEAPTPNLRRVAEKIEAQPAHMQNQFVKAFSGQYRKMVMVLATRGEDGYLKMRAIDSNRGNEIDSIINTWRENQKMFTDLWETNAAGKKILNTKLVKELADELQAILPLDRSSAEWEQRSSALFKRTLEANGIYLSDEAMQELRNKEKYMGNSKTDTGKKFGLSGLIGEGYNAAGKPKSIAEALIGRMAGYLKDAPEVDETDNSVDNSTDEDAFKINNPLYTEKSSMRYLAGTQLKYMTRVHSNTLKSADGKTIYSYGLNTSLSHAIRQFNTDPAFKEALSKASFNKHSWLLADPTRELTLGYMDGLKNEYGSRDGVTRPDMSDREQWATVLGLFQNKHMVSLTHSDKTQTPVFLNAPILPFGDVIDVSNGSFSLHPKFIDTVYQHVFMAEYERIQNQQAHNLKNYDVAKNLFYMLPILNKEHLQERLKNKQITEGHYTTIWGEDGTLNPISTPNFEKYVKQIIKAQLNKAVERTLTAWEDSKLTEDTLPGNESYFRSLLQYVNLNPKDKKYKEHFTNRDWRDGADNQIDGEGVKTTALTMAAMHYTANSFLFNTGLAQTFYGDPAGTFKPVKGAVLDGKMVTGKESASVISTMVEYGKRLAKDIAPGSDADWSDAPHYTAVTGADYEPIAREMKGMPGYEKGVPGTDAQELVTMKEYMVNLFKDGKITEVQKNTALNIIANAKDGYYTFENEPILKNVVFQPQKPVVSGMVSEGDVMRYDYIKSSAYPLYPPLTAGKEIDKLRKAMEKQNVDRFAYSSAKKTGAPKEPVSLFASDGTIDEDVFKTPVWEQSKQLLNRTNFRIQQEVPYEEDKDHILTVSQLNKNLVEHIATVKSTFDFQGEKLSGAELRQKKEVIRQQLIEQSHEKFMGKVGATFDAIHNPVLTDPKKLYSILAQEAATGAGYGNNDLLQLSSFVEGTNQLTVPLFLAASAGKFETKMMSLVRDIVKIKVPGHSFVQASSAGFKSIEGDTGERSGIIWTGELVTGELQTARKGDNNETIPAQILVSSAHFKRIMGQDIKDFIKDGKLELTDDQKKMMQMILARIPNQGHSSMLVAEIAGFLPESATDTMMVPMAITKQMGSDFDVDKVYTYNRTTGNKLMNDYFDVHWSVLTHPEMYESMMKPLDIDDAKAEADLLADKDGGYVDYFAPDYQMKDFQSMKGAKVLVGQTSLALTHNAEVQNKNIPLVTKTAEGFIDASIVVAGDNGKEIHLTHLSGYGESEYVHPKTGVKEKRSKADSIQIQQSEAVDHAKNRVVDKINLTPDTWAASNAISRLQSADTGIPGKEDFTPGQALPFSFNARLLMQPVIREFAAEMSLNNDTLSKNFIANVKESTFKGLSEKYEKLLRESLGIRADAVIPTAMQEIIDKHVFSPDSLYETIDMGRKAKPSAEFYARQLAALELFRKFDEIGSQIITLQSVMSQNTRGAGANMLDAWNVVEKTAKLETNPSEIVLGNTSSLFQNTEVGTTYKRTIGTATGVFHDILPYHRVAPLYNYIQEQLGRKGVDMSPKQKADVFRGLKSFIYSDSNLGLYENAQDERKRLLFSQDSASGIYNSIPDNKYIEMNGFDPERTGRTPLPWMPRNAKMRSDVKASNLIDAIKEGKRTSTSRTLTERKKIEAKIGGIDAEGNPLGNPYIWAKDDNGWHGKTLIKIIKVHQESNEERKLSPFDWSKSQAWDVSYIGSKPSLLGKGYFEVDFEHVPENSNEKTSKSLAIRVQEAKNTWGKNDHLLARLSTLIDPDGALPDRIEYSAAKVMNGNEQEENERSWLSGLKSEDAKKRELFEDLIRYNYVTGGLQNARNFVKFIPWAAIEGSHIAEGLRQSADRLRNIAESLPLKEQLYQHNPSLTRQLTKDLSETGTPLKPGDKPGVEFSLPRIQIDSPSPADGLAIMVTADDGTTYRTLPDYVHYRDGREVKLYKAVDWGDRVVYRQIDTLGDSKSGLLEYSSQPTGEARSIVEKNRVPEVKAEIIENKSITQRVLSQVGLPEAGGTFEDLHRSLDTIAGDRTQPEYLRTMANSLRKLQRNTVESTAYSDIFKLSKDFSIHLEDLGTADRARFDSVGNKMTFNLRSMSDRTGAAEDIIHETMHYHTGLLYAAYEGRESWEKRGYSEGLKEKLEKVRRLIEENPEFKAKLDTLDAVRKEAYENFNKQIIAKIGYDRWKAETAENKGEFGILHYGLSTPTEFIAHLFSNRQMIDYLNNQPATTESKGILSRIMDALKAVWGHIAQALGAKQGSKMEEAVYHALDILNYKQKLANSILNSPASDLSLMNAHIWNNAKNPTNLSTPIRKVTGKLEETRRSLIGDQTGLRDKQVSGALKSRVDKLEQQIEQLNKENDLSLIPKVAGEHLNWVDHVLANPSPSINELNAAEKLLNVWRYSQDVPFDISGRADSQIRLIVPIMQDRLIQVGAGAISTADFTPGELKDSNAIEANLRSANQSAKSKVSQLLSRYVETAVRGEDEEIRRRHITHMTLKDDMIAYGKANGLKLKDVYAKLMREGSNTWGLVTEYSQDWDNYQQEIRTKRNGALNAIEAKEGLTDADKARQKAKVWERFWSDAYAKGLFVDTRKFFEPETGELKTGKEFDNARATLVREYGEDKAAKLINEAQGKYKKYVEDRANRLQVLDDTLAIDLQNVEGMPEDTEEQKATKVAAKKELYAQHEAEQNSFKEKYSPNVFFSESAARSHSAAYEKYVTYAPKADAKEFWDERYQAVQKDAKLRDIYDRYKKAMNELSTFLPATVQQKMGPEFLPIVRESMMSDALDIPGYFRTMGERAVRSLTANEGQEGANNRTFNKIPIQHVEAGEADIADRSKDMIGILDMFSMMATHYKYASQAKAIVDMGNTILNEENKARLAGLVQVEQNGRMVTVRDALTNTIAALKNLEDVVLYRKPKKLEGALGSRIYSETNEGQGEKFSISPWRQAAIRKTIDELLLKRQDIQKRYAEADAENPYTDEEYNKDLEEVNKELDKYSGYQFYGSKIGDKLIKIGQLKAMSYNPFSAFANVTFGMISNAIHANGGTDFSWAHFGQALKIYHAARFDKAETAKIANMMDRLGIIGDYVDSSYGNRKKFHDEIPGWKHAISPFELMRKSDFYMKAVTTIATMLKHTVEVEEGGMKKTVNLYNTLNKEGYWDSEKYGERPEWHSSDPALESEWAKFQLKATRVNTIIHGNQDKANPKMLNSYILGRLIMQFRGSWLPEGWYSRFQEERYDDHLDRMVKGRYRTLGGLGLGGVLSVFSKQLLNLIPGVKVDPFTGHTIRSVDKEGNQVRTKLENSAVDVDNMRRNFAEAGFALMLTTMIVGLKHLHEKDDDKKWQYMMLMNTLIRTQQDINLYYTPGVFDQVFRNPVPAMAVLKDWGALMTASGKVIIDDDYEFSKWALKFTKAFPGLNHVNRIRTLVTKDISQLQ